jgi:hypothetical protein
LNERSWKIVNPMQGEWRDGEVKGPISKGHAFWIDRDMGAADVGFDDVSDAGGKLGPAAHGP